MTPALAAALAGEVTAVALCWKLTRGDGVVLGFTGHDRDLRIAGVAYSARPGMTPSAVSLSNGFTADSMDVEGVLGAAAISASDLDAGRWADARLELLACDWTAPEAGSLRLLRGTIGDVVRQVNAGEGLFRVEIRSDMARLDVGVVPRCSPLCRAELGDGRCGVDMGGRQAERTVIQGEADRLLLDADLVPAAAYAHGRLRLLSGALAGLDRRIARIEAATVFLEEPIWANGTAGAVVRLWEGCDKRFATCSDRFGNAAAFDGEPHVPGTDALIRYGDG